MKGFLDIWQLCSQTFRPFLAKEHQDDNEHEQASPRLAGTGGVATGSRATMELPGRCKCTQSLMRETDGPTPQTAIFSGLTPLQLLLCGSCGIACGEARLRLLRAASRWCQLSVAC